MSGNQQMDSRCKILLLGGICAIVLSYMPVGAAEMLPKHMTPATQKTIIKGLDYLSKQQLRDGSFRSTPDGKSYPVTMTALAGMAFLANGNTPTRGPYAKEVRKATRYLIRQTRSNGLIADRNENGRPMYGHGFSLLFLSTVYGMETDARIRKKIGKVIKNGITLTSTGQSNLGGWTYTPGGGDEGSVTVTQMQGLRAAHNAGFAVPKGTIENAVLYLEKCQVKGGGICYSYGSGGGARLPISAAAITCLYSAGEYESPLAKDCLKYVYGEFKRNRGEFQGGHDFYLNLYASQAFYQAGNKYWGSYYPKIRDRLIKTQDADGGWKRGGVGPLFGTSVGLIILQLPYKYLPIYQR